MPTQTKKFVDLGREVKDRDAKIKVDGLWWVVEQVGPPAVGGHRAADQGDGGDAVGARVRDRASLPSGARAE